MSFPRFLLATIAALMVLLALNMFVFPLVFPSGIASKFANMRSEPLVVLHFAALAATALLLTVLSVLMRPVTSSLGAAGVGAIAGLLASLPSALHTHALVDLAVSAELPPVIWTTVTWSVAAAVANVVYRWRSVRGPNQSLQTGPA